MWDGEKVLQVLGAAYLLFVLCGLVWIKWECEKEEKEDNERQKEKNREKGFSGN